MAATARAGGPGTSPRTAVVWDVLSAVLAELAASTDAASTGGTAPSTGGTAPSAGGTAPSAGQLSVVDAGGGTGGFAVPLAEAGHRVTVVDPSPDSLAALQRRAAERGVADRVTGVQGDLDGLAALVPDGTADLVLCHSVLEVVDDPAQALAAVSAALRPRGRLSLLVAGRDAAVVARAVAGHPDEAAHVLTDPRGRWGDGDGTARRFSVEELLPLLGAAGLQVEQVHGVRVLADLVPAPALELEPGAAAALIALERELSTRAPFRDLATQLHVLARRPD